MGSKLEFLKMVIKVPSNTIYHLFFGYLKLLLVWNFYFLILRNFSKQALITHLPTARKTHALSLDWSAVFWVLLFGKVDENLPRKAEK